MVSRTEISELLDTNVKSKLSYLPILLQKNVTENDSFLTVNTNIPCDMFNVACLFDPNINYQTIYKEFQGIPFACWTGFGTNGLKCKRSLEQFGLICDELEVGMFTKLPCLSDSTDNSILKIHEVNNNQKLNDFVSIYQKLIPNDKEAIKQFYSTASPFVLTPNHLFNSVLHMFVGYIEELPVSTGALFLDTNNIAGVWDITVLPAYRRKRIATHMVNHILNLSHTLYKADIAVLTASIDGEKVYSKIGFQKIKSFYIFNRISSGNQ